LYTPSVTLPDGRVFTLGGNRVSGLSGTARSGRHRNTWTQVPAPSWIPSSRARRRRIAPRNIRVCSWRRRRLFLPAHAQHAVHTCRQWLVQFGGTRGSGAALDEFSRTASRDVRCRKILKAGATDYDVGATRARFFAVESEQLRIDINGGGAAVTKIAVE